MYNLYCYEKKKKVLIKRKKNDTPQSVCMDGTRFAEFGSDSGASKKKEKKRGPAPVWCDLRHTNPWLKPHPRDTACNLHRNVLQFLYKLHGASPIAAV